MKKFIQKEPYIDLSSVEAKEVDWLLYPLIPFGMITILEGDPGIGKSYLAMHIAAMVSIGGTLPDGTKLLKGNVLYISAEDDAAYTIRPRIDAMGGDASRIRVQLDYTALDEAGLKSLMNEIKQNQPHLIIIDPIFAYVPSDQDMFRPNVIRALLSQLKDTAEYDETAVLLVRHLTKAKRDKAIYQGSGSMDVIGAARSAFLVAQHPTDPSLKVVVHIKHNISPRGQSWLYRLEKRDEDSIPILKWEGSSDLTAEDLMNFGGGGRKSASDEAKEFLCNELKDGPKPAITMSEHAEELGIALRTLDRAKKELNIVARKSRGKWIWALPEKKF